MSKRLSVAELKKLAAASKVAKGPRCKVCDLECVDAIDECLATGEQQAALVRALIARGFDISISAMRSHRDNLVIHRRQRDAKRKKTNRRRSS